MRENERNVLTLPAIMQKQEQMVGKQKIESPYKEMREQDGSVQRNFIFNF